MKSVSSNIGSLRPLPGALESNRSTPSNSDVANSGFRDQLKALQNATPLVESMDKGGSPSGLSTVKFSNHAIDRMQSRGIRFSPEQMSNIQGAIQKAAGKGAKNTLLLTDDSALIVSVKDNTVVTVMDKASLKENVFTNIDSTVMI